MRRSFAITTIGIVTLALASMNLGGCAVARIGGAAVKTTAWAGKTAVKGSVKGARAVGRAATYPLRER
jgi:hypothetical protein